MTQSPLLLERYFFTKVSIDAQANGDITAVNGLETKVDVKKSRPPIDPEKLAGYQDHYLVTLTLGLAPLDEKIPTYIGQFVVVGYFRVAPSYTREEHDRLVAINGASILFGVIREMVANITARGPFPMLTLISLNFSDLYPKKEETPAKDKSQTAHRRLRRSPSEEAVKTAQNVFPKVLEKGDPSTKPKR